MAMSEPLSPSMRAEPATFTVTGQDALLVVTRLEAISAALAQRRPILIDIPAVQWRLRLLARVQGWGGRLAGWLFDFLATFLLSMWLTSQLHNFSIPDWARFNFLSQPDNKVILTPLEE